MKTDIKIFLTIIVLIFTSCKDDKYDDILEGKLEHISLSLNTEIGSNGPLPPILHIDLSIDNPFDQEYLITAKGSKYDSEKSGFIIIDTLNKNIVPMYSTTHILLPKKKSKISCSLDMIELQKNIGLQDSFFNKNDYREYKQLLTDKCVALLKRSIIIYVQDSTELNKIHMLDKKAVLIRQIIKFEIPNKIMIYDER